MVWVGEEQRRRGEELLPQHCGVTDCQRVQRSASCRICRAGEAAFSVPLLKRQHVNPLQSLEETCYGLGTELQRTKSFWLALVKAVTLLGA